MEQSKLGKTRIQTSSIIVKFPKTITLEEARSIVVSWNPDTMKVGMTRGYPTVYATKKPQFDRSVAKLLARGVTIENTTIEPIFDDASDVSATEQSSLMLKAEVNQILDNFSRSLTLALSYVTAIKEKCMNHIDEVTSTNNFRCNSDVTDSSVIHRELFRLRQELQELKLKVEKNNQMEQYESRSQDDE
jgi:hypothetical protein